MASPAASVTTASVAIITGADSGIGRATAIALARDGARIAFIYDQDDEGAQETSRLVKEVGTEAIAVKGDVGDPKDVDRLFDQSKQAFGPPTILVNGAGIDASGTPVKELELAAWEKCLRTNLTGPVLCCRRFLNDFVPGARRGKIVNITSVHEDIPRAGASDYCASKGGLRNLTRCLALELAEENVSVVNVAPGMVLTPMNQEALDDPKVLQEQVQSIPMKRAAEPEEVAGLIRYLVSPEGDYCCGTTYVMDGGLMMNQGQGA